MLIEIDQSVPAFQSYAAERARGLYNVDAADGQQFRIDVDIPAEDSDWSIGVVVGPSGSGKSSIGRALAAHGWSEWTGGRWAKEKPVIEVLGGKEFDRASAALAAVGLGSVPSWLRPKHVLSTGEQFRAELAALLLKADEDARVIVDEFTSVLDRQVAQVGAGAFAKSWRKIKGRQIILVTCHYDILDWVQPDWVLDTHEADALPGDERQVVQARQGDFQAATNHAGYPGDRVGAVVC